MRDHSLITTLKSLTGNPRGCVYTEPLFGIPYNLYSPYISVYMLAMGLNDQQIGLILSISWGFQIITVLLSGVITDKLGRRRTTLIFDLFAWTLPCLIAAAAQNFWYFLAVGIFNSFLRITHNSWTCLLVEDADQEQLVDIYTWIYIANQVAGFISPLTGLLINAFTLVPTMRGLYLLAAVMLTIKFVLTYQMTEETEQGKIRLRETRGQSILAILGEYRGVLQKVLHSPQTLYTAGIMLVFSISVMINGSFWGIIVTEKLRIPASSLAIFPLVRSAVMLFFFFMVMPHINRIHFKLPMIIGFLGLIASQLLLIVAPEQGYVLLVLNISIEACCLATVWPLLDKLVVLMVNAQERARIQSIMGVGIILLTSPFGWIAGLLSTLDKGLPFILNIILFAVGALLTHLVSRVGQPDAIQQTSN